VIDGLDKVSKLKKVVVFHAGTKKTIEGFVTERGSGVRRDCARQGHIKAAIDNAYKAVSLIHFDGMHFRRDIGWRALKNMRG